MAGVANSVAAIGTTTPRRSGSRTRTRRTIVVGGLRFAFYGRMSTAEFQERDTSLRWQREVAEETICGRGMIVAEYFDQGCSRGLPWHERPAAARLLADAARPDH